MSQIPQPKHHVGNVGTLFRRNLLDESGNPVDLTDNDGITFRFGFPFDNGVPAGSVDRVGVVVGLPTAGVVEYTTVVGDLQVPGRWQVQVIVSYTSGNDFAAEANEFKVEQRIAAP